MADTIATAERTLPHNLEAERSVLGAILVHNDAFNTAAQVIDGRDFYRDAHRRIFDRMVTLNERGEAIDFITLKEELSRGGELDDVGGPAYVASLVDGVPRATNVEYYAKIVKEKSTLRNLIYAANKILTNAYEADQESDLILDEAESSIFAVADDRLKAGFVAMRDLVNDSFPKIEQLFEHKRLVTGVPTGFVDLDEMTRGLQGGDLIIVAARPSMGKTSLVLNMAQHVAVQPDLSVGFFSLEMSKESLFIRLLTSEAQIDSHRLMSGHIGEKDYGRISQALETLSGMKLFIDDTANIGVLEMRAKSRRLQAEHGLSLIIVDYIQLMSGRGRFENRTLELASISRSLKGLAKELNVPIVVLSQLSRAPESRSDHRPQLSDLRESGALEQDADLVVLIYRDDAYNRDPNNPEAGTAELIVAHVDLEALQANLRAITDFLASQRPGNPPRVIAVVKANAYGHGSERVALALEAAGANLLACADIEEAIVLRRAGVCAPILVFGALSVSDLDGLFEFSLTPTISTPSAVRAVQGAAARHKQTIGYHLKIDTGMNRLGFRHDNLRRTLPALFDVPNLRLDAIYTHFASADDPDTPHFDEQRQNFEAALKVIDELRGRDAFGDPTAPRPLIHAANSAATLRDSRVWYDMVRPGLLLYGIVPPPLASTIPLTPVMSLTSRVVAVKGVRPGEGVGYGFRFTADKPVTTAVIPAGYADGIDLRVSGRCSVLIRGRRVPIVGAVSMDMMMVDVTDLDDVSPGDEVVIIGRQGDESWQQIDAREMAAAIGTIPWEIVCRIGSRIERQYAGTSHGDSEVRT